MTTDQGFKKYVYQDFHLLAGVNIIPQRMEETPQNHVILLHQTESPVKILEMAADEKHYGLARSGDVNFIPAQMDNSCSWEDPLSYIRVDLNPFRVHSIAEQEEIVIINDFKASIRESFPKVAMILRWMYEEAVEENSRNSLYMDSLVNMLTVRLLRKHQTMIGDKVLHASPVAYREVIAYMREHLDQAISIEQLTRMTHQSPSHFMASFKKVTGYSPHQYVLKLRIEESKRLFRENEMTASEIAIHLGFNDQSHFTRHFKKIIGMTPLQWKRDFIL